MEERRKSKKTFIRYAGKAVFVLDIIVVLHHIISMHLCTTDIISAHAHIYGFLTFITGFVWGAAGWSDHRKEKRSNYHNPLGEVGL